MPIVATPVVAAPSAPVVSAQQAPAAAPVAPVAPVAPTAPVAPAETPDTKQASAFAAIAKKEAALVKREREFRAREVEFQKHQPVLAEYERIKGRSKADPLGALKLLGLTYDEVTAAQLNDGRATPELIAQVARDELELYKQQQAKEREDAAKATAETQKAEDERLRSEVGEEAKALLVANPDTYELISLYGEQDRVLWLMQENFAKTGKMVSVKDAADAVEAYLTAQWNKAKAAKKFQAATVPPVTDDKRNESTQRRTISNDMTASTQATSRPPMTMDERFERAAAAMDKAARKSA